MFKKMAFGMVAVALATVAALGCAGDTGKGEGDGCQSINDCGGLLQCQPVEGRSGGPYCCPAPLLLPSGQFVSSQTNCQPTTPTH